MPQIGFFVGAAGAGLFGIPMGAANLTIAWDSFGTGPGSSLGLVYKTYMLSNIVGGGRVRNYKPVTVAPYKASTSPLGRLNIVKFMLSGHTNYASWVDLTLKVFDPGTGKQIYSAADGTGQDTLRVQVKGYSTASTLSFEDTLESIHDDNNAI